MRINQTGTWNEIPGLALRFELPEPASIRVLYSISVMPDQNFVNDGEAWMTLWLITGTLADLCNLHEVGGLNSTQTDSQVFVGFVNER